MTLDLLKRSEKAAELSAAEHDANLTAIENEVNGKAESSHTHTLSDVTDSGTAASKDVSATGDAATGEVVKGDDTRLTDARTPTAHAAGHASGGGDAVDHDTLTNFVADEHVAHSGVILTAGTGLTGGGDISASRTLNLADTAVTPASYTNADITVDQQGRITAAANGSAAGDAAPSQVPSDANPYTLPLTSRAAFNVEIPTHANDVEFVVPNTAPAGSKWAVVVGHTGNYAVIEGGVGTITPNQALNTGGDATHSKQFVSGGIAIIHVRANAGSAPDVEVFGADQDDSISGAVDIDGDRIGRLVNYTGTGDTWTVSDADVVGVVAIKNNGSGTITLSQGTGSPLDATPTIPAGKLAFIAYSASGLVATPLVQA